MKLSRIPAHVLALNPDLEIDTPGKRAIKADDFDKAPKPRKPLPPGPIAISSLCNYSCPEHGENTNCAVSNWTPAGGHVAMIRFICGCEMTRGIR